MTTTNELLKHHRDELTRRGLRDFPKGTQLPPLHEEGTKKLKEILVWEDCATKGKVLFRRKRLREMPHGGPDVVYPKP